MNPVPTTIDGEGGRIREIVSRIASVYSALI